MSTLKFMRCELPAAFYAAIPTVLVILTFFGRTDNEEEP